VDVQEKHQFDMTEHVAQVRARARPWRSIIALILAAIAAGASWWATDHGKHPLTLAGHPADRLLNVACAIAFCVLALVAILGFSGKAREVLLPRIGSAHAAVVSYAIVLAGGLTSLLITLQLLRLPVGNLILGGAFTAVLIGIAAQQTLGNLFAGIMLQLARPFVVGDSVRMRAGVLSGQIEGIVTDIGITYVRLDTDEGKLNVPNSQVLAAAVGPLRRSPAEMTAPPGTAAPGTAASAAASAATGVPVSSAVPAATAAAAAAAPPSDGAAPQHAGPVTGRDGTGQAGSAEGGPQR
jgi:Mechanosensitive ion channel